MIDMFQIPSRAIWQSSNQSKSKVSKEKFKGGDDTNTNWWYLYKLKPVKDNYKIPLRDNFIMESYSYICVIRYNFLVKIMF